MTSTQLPVAPALRRRLACFVYEGVLLFGVVMAAGFLYAVTTGQRHALQGTTGLQATLFLVFGAYFVGLWSARGQTLAMQTWRIRVVGPAGEPPSRLRAAGRYLLSWLWFVPALLSLRLAGVDSLGTVSGVLIAGVAAYALSTLLRADRQYWHDVLAGTRIVAA